MECDAQASATRSRETLCRPYLMHPPNTVTVQQPKSLQASLPSWAAAANSSNSVIPRRYRTVTGMLPGTDWFLARRFGTPCPRSDRRQRPMIKQSTLHAALSLVALIAGCSHDTPARPSATRAGVVAAAMGDDERTDCHDVGKDNGRCTPSERLQAGRTLCFPAPGQTLGRHPGAVFSQANDPDHSQYVENVWWNQRNVVFAAMNITGSFNDLAPWSSASRPWLVTPADMPSDWASFPSQADEVAARAQADRDLIAQTFATATKRNARGVVLAFQADMWDPAEQVKDPATFNAGYDA